MGKMELLRKFARRASSRDVLEIGKKLGAMNRGPVQAIWGKVQQLWQFIRDPEVAWSRKAMAAGSLLYLVSPLDAVPDVIPVGGLLDDVAVILFVARVLAGPLKNYAVDVLSQTAEARAEVEIRKHYRMIWASVLGAIAIAGIVLVLKLL
jgi:uncharacterized membrane protein YkvA (DUF1232 family)